ncbi:transposase, partial [Escherichia coli]|nr:transposase [Escherichia coli]
VVPVLNLSVFNVRRAPAFAFEQSKRATIGGRFIRVDESWDLPRKLKRIIGATLGFKSMKTAYATIKGIEVMRALRKGQASAFYYG